MSLKLIFIACLLITLSNCASRTKTLYDWNNYENTFYKYNKNDINLTELEEKLAVVITKSEIKGRVPPGLYAEYGYILLESGKFDEAIKYFTKESDMWPESGQFMNTMIKRANLQKKQKSGK